MCTQDITGSNNYPKKLLLSISEKDFLKHMIFLSKEDRRHCIHYLGLKGISYHVVLANYIGFDSNDKVEYNRVAALYQYDKRIRNILYKFISAFEEGIRGYISNRYSQHVKNNKRLPNVIKDNINNGSTLSKELENLVLNDLLELSRNLPPKALQELYGTTENLEINHKAIKELRNAVSHHRLMFVYDAFEECIVGSIKDNSLIHNLKNFEKMLLPYYRGFYKQAINNSSKDNDNENFENLLPERAKLCL